MRSPSPAAVTAALAVALLACGGGSGGGSTTQYTATVTPAGAGTGTVTSSAGGIDCGATCTASFASGTSVTLSATPAVGSTFSGFTGACTGTRCVLAMTADRAVTATFALASFGLAVSKAGTGLGTVTDGADLDCGFMCDAVYLHGTEVTLMATPGAGATFAGWSGACTGTGDCVVPMTARQAVTATFDGAAVADAVESAGCGKTRTLLDGTKTIESNGSRTYILKTPADYDNTHPYRLVVAYHWRYADAQAVAGQGYYGLLELSDASTIFVAPTGTDQNGMGMGWPNTDDQDMAFTDAILAQVEAELCIDTSRVFATGWSWGAAMSYAVACERANVFRGVALYSAGEVTAFTGCEQPIAYWAAHGVSDDVLEIAGGRTMRDRFVTANGCTAQTPTDPAAGSGTHLCTAYQGCSAGHPVTWCGFDGGHMWNALDRSQTKTWVPTQVWNFINGF